MRSTRGCPATTNRPRRPLHGVKRGPCPARDVRDGRSSIGSLLDWPTEKRLSRSAWATAIRSWLLSAAIRTKSVWPSMIRRLGSGQNSLAASSRCARRITPGTRDRIKITSPGRRETQSAVASCGNGASDDLLPRLDACEPHLAENAVVLIENCNRPEIRNAGLQFLRSSRNQYRVLLDRRTPNHGSLTFGDGLLLFQLLGRNAVVARHVQEPTAPALVPAA